VLSVLMQLTQAAVGCTSGVKGDCVQLLASCCQWPQQSTGISGSLKLREEPGTVYMSSHLQLADQMLISLSIY
jgi:hypothetical protein